MTVAVEIAVQDLAGLEVAAAAGASRVELCSDLSRGGITPPAELVTACAQRAAELLREGRARPGFGVHVLVRPAAGEGDFRSRPEEFVYSQEEAALMARSAAALVGCGAAGIVTGALTADGRSLDREVMGRIADTALTAAQAQARSIELTCHRCLDALPDAAARTDAIPELLALGFHRALTSGGAARAIEGSADIASMVAAADGLVDVMAGGGVRPADIGPLVQATGVRDVHLSARLPSGRAADTPDTETDPAVAAAAVDAAGAL